MKYVTCLTLIVLLFFLAVNSSLAAPQGGVNATIKLSVCGNGVGEHEEECDGSDLRGKSCSDLGYSGGTLSCDHACSFKVDACKLGSRIATPSSFIRRVLPDALRIFDIQGLGKILVSDLSNIVQIWVDDWKNNTPEDGGRCDINKDGDCNTRDFSVLMYYIER